MLRDSSVAPGGTIYFPAGHGADHTGVDICPAAHEELHTLEKLNISRSNCSSRKAHAGAQQRCEGDGAAVQLWTDCNSCSPSSTIPHNVRWALAY